MLLERGEEEIAKSLTGHQNPILQICPWHPHPPFTIVPRPAGVCQILDSQAAENCCFANVPRHCQCGLSFHVDSCTVYHCVLLRVVPCIAGGAQSGHCVCSGHQPGNTKDICMLPPPPSCHPKFIHTSFQIRR